MPPKYFQEHNKRKFSDSLNSQRWRFLKSGLDDFRNGFPPPSDNIIICGTKGPVPIVLRNRASDASRMAQQKGRKKCTKTQVSPSKLSPLQKARRDHIAQTEHCLSQHPLALYSHLEESIPPELFKEVVGILDPEMRLNSEGGYEDCDLGSHTPQQGLYQPEDGKSKEACPRPSPLSKESKGKNLQYTYLSKKEVAAREKEASLSYVSPLDENVRRVTKEFCDWVDSLDPSQPKWEKIRYGAWYLEPKTWRKQRANEPLEDPNTTVDAVQNLRNQFSEKEAELMQLHGTHAFKEFLERKGYRKPEFLLQMLAAGDANGGQEWTSKDYRKESLKRPEGIREGSSSTIVN
ncbi:protein FAM47E-like isoform 3-T4 [Pangshura tecta]